MDGIQAHRIVSALANGTNPLTGEAFPADSPYQSPHIIRALYAATRALESNLQCGPQSAAAKGSSPEDPPKKSSQKPSPSGNAGKPWSTDEDRQLLAAFDAGKPLADIAQLHQRTLGGVRARLEKHGRLEPSTATRWPAGRTSTSSGLTGGPGGGSRSADKS